MCVIGWDRRTTDDPPILDRPWNGRIDRPFEANSNVDRCDDQMADRILRSPAMKPAEHRHVVVPDRDHVQPRCLFGEASRLVPARISSLTIGLAEVSAAVDRAPA